MPVKWATKAVILNDMEMLKDAIENRDIVASVCSGLLISLKNLPTNSRQETDSSPTGRPQFTN